MFSVALVASAVVADEDVKKTEKRGIYSTGLGYGGYGGYAGGLGGYGGGLYSPTVYSSPLYSGYSSVSVHPSYAYTSGYPYAYKGYGGLGGGYGGALGGYGGYLGGSYGSLGYTSPYLSSPYYGGLVH